MGNSDIMAINSTGIRNFVNTGAKSVSRLSTDIIVAGTDIINAINDAYCESKRTEVAIEEIRAKREIVLTDIKKRYDLYNQIFMRLFDERKEVISKNFQIIEKGIADNNDTLIGLGLGNLSKIVTSSPFAAFSDFQKQLQSGEAFEL